MSDAGSSNNEDSKRNRSSSNPHSRMQSIDKKSMASVAASENSLHRQSPPKFQEDVMSSLRKAKPADVEETLNHFKWIEAIRTADMTSLGNLLKKYQDTNSQVTSGAYGTPLHLACSFANKAVVEFLLNSKVKFPINAQDAHGNTCLHLAAKTGRIGIVELLYTKAGSEIDDTIVNSDLRDCKDVSKNSDIVMCIDNHRKQFIIEKSKQIHTASAAGDFQMVQKLYQDNRTLKLVDINTPDQMTGETILHDAAALGNYDMVVWCLKMKADPLIRDKRGKLPVEKAKNDKIKNFLKGVLSQAASLGTSSAPKDSIKMKGMLYKWTNYAGGYKKRWFVLDEGILSYYRTQEDEPVSCRGSISLKVAKLWIDASDRNRFDIVGRGNVRYHLRAEHPMEAKRWVIALTETKQWLQDNKEFHLKMESKLRSHSSSASHDNFSHYDSDKDGSEKSFEIHNLITSNSLVSFPETELDRSSFSEIQDIFDENFHATANSALACVHYQKELVMSLAGLLHSTGGTQSQIVDTFSKSSENLYQAISELVKMNEAREIFYQRALDREKNMNKVWEENLRALAVEHEALKEKATNEMNTLETQTRNALSNSQLELTDDELDEFYDAESEYNKDMKQVSTHIEQASIKFNESGYWDNPPDDFRKYLPMVDSDTKFELSIWSVLKNNIGKDLSKIALPVVFNEPLSMLQRLCEDMEYSTLLDIASSKSDSLERIQYVAAFAASNYSSTLNRTSKPFNPLLGETFEYVRKDLGFRYLAEQVSHHPPISACFCESEHYVFWQEATIKSKFWGKSFEIFPLGNCHVLLKKTNEHFSWKKVTTCANNLIMGKIWLDHYGDMIIKNHSSGEECTLTFKAAGWRGKGQYEIEGTVKSKEGNQMNQIWGHWNDRLMSKPLSPTSSSGSVLWKKNVLPDKSEKMFHLTEFAVSLNDMAKDLRDWVCITDSRHRPDQRAMENGNYDLADKEKIRLEDKQRIARHKRSEEGKEWEPTWFRRETEPDTKEDHWVYKGGYWENRNNHFKDCSVPNIY